MCMHSLMSAINETRGSLWCSGLKVSVRGFSTSTPGALPFVKWSMSCLIKFRLILSLPHPPSCGQKPCFSNSNDGKGERRRHSQHSLWLVIDVAIFSTISAILCKWFSVQGSSTRIAKLQAFERVSKGSALNDWGGTTCAGCAGKNCL